MSLASPFLGTLFAGSDPFDEVLHVSLPFVGSDDLQVFVESVYTGSIPASEDVFDRWKSLVSLLINLRTSQEKHYP